MTGKDLLIGLGDIDPKYYHEAETIQPKMQKHIVLRRPLLIAALISLLLLLVGCAVVYALRLQNMKIGKIIESQPVMAENDMEIVGYQDVELEVLTLAGLKGSPNYQAAQEWYRFTQSYDPYNERYYEMREAGTLMEYPPEFNGMPIYSQEMRDTIDGILSKYNLLPPGELLEFRTLKLMCKALGIEKIQTAQNDVGIRMNHGSCSSNGNFRLTMQIELPMDEEGGLYDTWGSLYWCRKDCFTPDYTTIEDTNDWKEWNYTTASGSNVLIFRSPSDWRGWIVCQREEAQLVLQVETRKDIYRDNKIQCGYLTDRQMELISDTIDFSIQPKKVTQEDVLNQPPFLPGRTQNGWSIEVKNVNTDGYMVELLLGIAAPEDMDITHVESDDTVYPYYDIHPGDSVDFFVPEQGTKNGYGWSWFPQEDGDGKDNTIDYIMTFHCNMMDGSVPFAEGKVWRLQIEDLMHYRWDAKKQDIVNNLLTEGEWNFSIQFGEENGDFDHIDLLTAPRTMPVITAWEMNGNETKEIWETCEVNKIEIHPMSVHFFGNRANVDYGWTNVVMKDGTQIPLSILEFDRRCIYESTQWIDLHKVDYLLMQDGTKLPVPEK